MWCFQLCGSSVCEVDNYRECAQCAVAPEDRCLTLDCPTVELVPRVDPDGQCNLG